jgi:4-carboxymuconolactone decarboxylase
MTQSTRIPYPEGAPAEGAALNIVRMLGYMPPDIGAGFEALSRAVMTSPSLDAVLRELVILRVGHLAGSAYEIHQHNAFARHLGAREEVIRGLAAGSEDPVFNPKEKALLKFVEDLVVHVRPSDSALAGIRRHFDVAAIFAIIVTVGQYMMVCRLIETTGIPIEGDASLSVSSISQSGNVGIRTEQA